MRKFPAILFFLLIAPMAFAQTQQGFVKTIGRPEQPGVMLEKVLVQTKGMFNATTSNEKGEFSINIPGKKDGDPLVFLRVRKKGYVLKDKDLIGRSNVCSSKVPIIIQMVDSSQLQADIQRIEKNAQRVAEENYQKKLAVLQQQKDSSELTAEQFRQELLKLEDQYEKYLSLIGDMADRYARTDYDNLDSIDREINICIENGNLNRADSLIHTVFDPETVLERNRAAKKEIQDRINLAQSIIDQASSEREAIMQDIEYAKRFAILCESLAWEYIGTGKQGSALDCLKKAFDIKKIIYGENSNEAHEIQNLIKEIGQKTRYD